MNDPLQWAKRLERVLQDAPLGVEALVTHGQVLVCPRGTHAKAMEAGGADGENAVIEAGTWMRFNCGPLRPYGEAL